MRACRTTVMAVSIFAFLCVTSSVLTTRCVEARDVTGARYEVFFIGAPDGCTATTMTFKEDQVLVFECIDGFGIYWTLANSFAASFWSNNYYEGNGAVFFLAGIALDPFIVAGGIALYGNDVRLAALTGYILSAPQ